MGAKLEIGLHQFQEPLRSTTSASRIAVHEGEGHRSGIDFVAVLAEYFIVEAHTYLGHFGQRNPNRQQIVVIGRGYVSALHLNHREHDAVFFHVVVGGSELPQHLGPGRFVVSDVVRVVNDSHAVGFVVSDPNFNVSANHDRMCFW